MRLVNGVGVLVAQLVHYLLYLDMILSGEAIPYESFEFEGAAFAFVVELVVQRLRDIEVHCEVGQTLHVEACAQ